MIHKNRVKSKPVRARQRAESRGIGEAHKHNKKQQALGVARPPGRPMPAVAAACMAPKAIGRRTPFAVFAATPQDTAG